LKKLDAHVDLLERAQKQIQGLVNNFWPAIEEERHRNPAINKCLSLRNREKNVGPERARAVAEDSCFTLA